MSPEFIKELNKLADLIEVEKLPNSAIPRLFYMGHKLIGTKSAPLPYDIKCVQCDNTWPLYDEYAPFICPLCNSDENAYILDYSKTEIVMWECLACKHEWEGWNGTYCPKCKVFYKDCKKQPNQESRT